MALNIKNEKVENLIRQLAKTTGEGITEVIGNAVEEKLTKLRQANDTKLLEEELLEVGRRNAARKLLDNRSADEILGYDKDGLPGGA
jgi:antitoxin VapB